MSEYRLYSFVNYYLSQIQQGIQTAHIVSELMSEASTSVKSISSNPLVQEIEFDKADIMVHEWADSHKTIIVCNGGNRDGLVEVVALFNDNENRFPWTTFHEDEQSLSGALTAVGIVLPEEIYDAKPAEEEGCWVCESEYRHGQVFYPAETFEARLITLIKSKRLA